jgi:hypothetical protein
MNETADGQVTKISTTADGCVRLTIDIPRESCPENIISWKDQSVVLALVAG